MQVCIKSLLSFQSRQSVYSKLSVANFQTYSPVYAKKKEEKTKKSPKGGDKSKDRHFKIPTDEPNDSAMSIKVLNVAEKNDAAKNIAQLLSNGTARRVSKHQHHKFGLLRGSPHEHNIQYF